MPRFSDSDDFSHLPTVDSEAVSPDPLPSRPRPQADAVPALEAAPVVEHPPVEEAPAPAEPVGRKIKYKTRPAPEPEPVAAPEPEPPAPPVSAAAPARPKLKLRVRPGARATEAVTAAPELVAEPEAVAELAAVTEPKDKTQKSDATKKAHSSSESSPSLKSSPSKEAKDPASEATPEAEDSADEKPEPMIAPKGEDKPLTRAEIWRERWKNLGGRSLMLSVGLHVGLLIFAALIVFSYTQERSIDFLSGGGTKQGEQASKSLENQVTRKRSQWLNRKLPMQRIAVDKAMSAIQLPESKLDTLDLPLTRDFMNAGKMGSKGFGSSGAGGGFGNGIGVGGKSGVTFGPLSMFGKRIDGKRIVVVMDVSPSMTPFLEEVVQELDRVAPGSPVILYKGCGLMPPPDDRKLVERVERTQHPYFQVWWRIWQGNIPMTDFETVIPGTVKYDRAVPPPEPDVFNKLLRRNETYFVQEQSIKYAWLALVNDVTRNADTIYWFSDFEDPTDISRLLMVRDNVLVRRQKLYIHALEHGASFNRVVKEIVEPTRGDVIEPRRKKR